LKKSANGEAAFKLPMELAAFRNAIFSRLLPFGNLLDKTFPPLILLFGDSLSHEAKCLALGNFFLFSAVFRI
jgi:hypothetical protein